MAFRGCGKSTLVGLWCAWTLLRDPQARILVLAADAALATRMVANVRRILTRHPLCTHLLPDGPGEWAADRFTVRREGALRDPSMLAAGILGNITGSRADVIVCDDVEVAGNCDTPARRAELRERLAETEFVLTPGGTILYVGTPHCAETLYLPPGDERAFLRGYHRLRLPLLDAAGRSAWPERFGMAAVAALRERVGPLHFARQMMLEATEDAAARLDPRCWSATARRRSMPRAAGAPSCRCSAAASSPAAATGTPPMAAPAAAMPACSPRSTPMRRATSTCTAWPI